MKGSDVLLKCLAKEDVNYIFGIPGGQLIGFLEGIKEEGEDYGIDFITTRHEQAATHMADSWCRVAGNPGVCLGTVGPGAADLVPGTYEAFQEGSPVIVLTAQNQSWKSYPDHGSMQGCDQKRLFEGVTKWNCVVDSPERIPELVQRAFKTALSSRQGPVHLDLPVDVLFEEVDENELVFADPEEYRATSLPVAGKDVVREAAEKLAEAERPLIHSGGGVVKAGAEEELRKVAEYLSAPVTVSQSGISTISDDHPLSLQPNLSPGGVMAQNDSDVILAVGTRFTDSVGWGKPDFWGDPQDQTTIQVDVSPERIAENRKVDLPVVGDAKMFLKGLLGELRKITEKTEERENIETYRETDRNFREDMINSADLEEPPIHPLKIMKVIRNFYPKNSITVLDGGTFQVWAHLLPHAFGPGNYYICSPHSGMLGGGLPKAISAKLARPDEEVFLLTGDGSFMLNIQELETAKREEVDITVIVGNDRSWGMIKTSQESLYGRSIGVDFSDVRYDKIAEGMGCYGDRVTDPQTIRSALKDAKDSDNPAVIDAVMDKEANQNPPFMDLLNQVWMEGIL